MNVPNYERQIFKPGQPNCFILPWGYVLLRNINKAGDLVIYDNISLYKKSESPVWILCKVLIFRSGQHFFPVYSCDKCESMKTLDTLRIDQTEETIRKFKCLHSHMAEIVVRNSGRTWQDHWQFNLTDVTPQDQACQLSCGENIKHQTLRDDDLFLAVIKTDKDNAISVLATVTKNKQMKKPFCNRCVTRLCKCLKTYRKLMEECEPDAAPHYWERKNLPPRREVAEDYNDFHDDSLGFNKTEFPFPPTRDEEFAEKLRLKEDGLFQYPEKFIPEYKFGEVCHHNNLYDYRDENLILLSEEVTVYSEKSEEILQIPMYGRPTEGDCSCVKKADTHEHLLHNISTARSGRFVCYTFLIAILLQFVSGTAINKQFNTRFRYLKSIGRKCSLGIQNFTRAVIGFATNLRFRKQDWTCEICGMGGDTPRYLVCDGKQVGPTKRKIEHLKEHGVSDCDHSVLGIDSFNLPHFINFLISMKFSKIPLFIYHIFTFIFHPFCIN